MDERGGATSVEMALLWTVMTALIVAVVQVALVFYAGQLALTAAEDGLRTGRYFGVDDPAGAASRSAVAFLDRTAGTSLQDIAVTAAVDGSQVLRVTVSGSALSFLPGVSLHVRREAAGALERVAP
jgi:Flp pilus assembly pilin Flp